MYKCDDCKSIFNEYHTYTDDTDTTYRGMTASYEYDGCPNCRSTDFIEITPCLMCNSYSKEDDEPLCSKCEAKILTDENILGFGEYEKESIELNSFIVSCFTTSEIEEILLRKLKEVNYKDLQRDFLLENAEDITRYIKRKEKENENE